MGTGCNGYSTALCPASFGPVNHWRPAMVTGCIGPCMGHGGLGQVPLVLK